MSAPQEVIIVDKTGQDVSSQPENGAVVTPSDTVNLTKPSKIWVGTAGNIAIVMNGNEAVLTLLAFSGWLPVQVKRVNATNTTATNIVAFWSNK
jgi:hypothetical protein